MFVEIVEMVLVATGVGVVAVPAYFVKKSGMSKKLDEARATIKGMDDLMLKERDVWYAMGKKHALAEVERLHTEQGLGYREAANKINKSCAECGRKCLHCAKEDKG